MLECAAAKEGLRHRAGPRRLPAHIASTCQPVGSPGPGHGGRRCEHWRRRSWSRGRAAGPDVEAAAAHLLPRQGAGLPVLELADARLLEAHLEVLAPAAEGPTEEHLHNREKSCRSCGKCSLRAQSPVPFFDCLQHPSWCSSDSSPLQRCVAGLWVRPAGPNEGMKGPALRLRDAGS